MIGIFDSGLGGLSVLAAIASRMPAANLTYLADSAHLPYGSKSDEFVRSRVLAIGAHLVLAGCRVLVVACNTATAAAIEALRAAHPQVPVVGVEPGVKPAAMASRSGRIAILATESTSRSNRLAGLIRAHANGVVVDVCPCPGWATRVEALNIAEPAFAREIGERVGPLVASGCDHIVLGCTHYAFLKPAMQAIVAGRAKLVDVAEAIARRTLHLAGDSIQGHGSVTLLATRSPARLTEALEVFGLSGVQQKVVERPTLVHC